MKAAKKQSVVVKILLAVLAVLVILGGLTAAAIYKWYSSPETQEKLGAARDLVRMSVEASQAPGAKELRNLGCRQAAIFDKDQADRYLASIGKVMAAPNSEKLQVPLVLCGIERSRNLSCESVAGAYGSAAENAEEEVLVMVQKQGLLQEVVCAGVYSKKGSLVQKIDVSRM